MMALNWGTVLAVCLFWHLLIEGGSFSSPSNSKRLGSWNIGVIRFLMYPFLWHITVLGNIAQQKYGNSYDGKLIIRQLALKRKVSQLLIFSLVCKPGLIYRGFPWYLKSDETMSRHRSLYCFMSVSSQVRQLYRSWAVWFSTSFNQPLYDHAILKTNCSWEKYFGEVKWRRVHRASPAVLSMRPCKNISHNQV
jgi:hypothetical protein